MERFWWFSDCSWHEILWTVAYFIDQEDLGLTSACLEYLESVCKCTNTEVDLLDSEQKLTLWSTLYKLFSNLLEENSTKTAGEEDKNFTRYDLVSGILGGKSQQQQHQYFTGCSFEWLSQDGETPQPSWSWTRKRMIFEGRLGKDGWKLIFQQVQSAIGAVIFCLDVSQLQTVVDSIVSDCVRMGYSVWYCKPTFILGDFISRFFL
jgi:hypothetical protein